MVLELIQLNLLPGPNKPELSMIVKFVEKIESLHPLFSEIKNKRSVNKVMKNDWNKLLKFRPICLHYCQPDATA